MVAPRHFLDLESVGADALKEILTLSHRLKSSSPSAKPQALTGKTVVLVFEKPSTRTRLSFDIAVQQLGAHPITINTGDMQLGRGETVADTARTISRYADAIMLRTVSHERLLELAEFSSIPVINGLTDRSHPCQVVADLLTLEEHTGGITGKVVAWVGDPSNVCTSWMQAAKLLGITFRLSCPLELKPKDAVLQHYGAAVQYYAAPEEAVQDADCVLTDTWISMGQQDVERRRFLLAPYQVTTSLMALAKPTAIFQHCLPAVRGQEVTENVLDGSQSVVWDEAENRLHVQKAILLWTQATIDAA